MMEETQQRELFKKFLAEARIVIADTSSASRARLAKTLVDLGAKMQLIELCGTYAAAEEAIRKSKPRLLVSDYHLGSRSGFDLLDALKECGDPSKRVFALVTANSSQSTIARAAEEDVDVCVLKPYTIQMLSRALVSAAINKLHPSPYLKGVAEGKALIGSKDYEGAIRVLTATKALDPIPTLALAYLGQAEELRKQAGRAEGSYQNGITLNRIHYKCLLHLYELYASQGKHEEAYKVVKRIAKIFPSNPKRLGAVIRLAIVTENYSDMSLYYELFKQIEERSEDLVRYICAGLIVCAKHYLIHNNRTKALELMEQAGVTCAGSSRFLRLIIETLTEYRQGHAAREYLKRFLPKEQAGQDYRLAAYYVIDQMDETEKSLEIGRNLAQAGIHQPRIYITMIRKMIKLGSTMMLENYLDEGSRRFPEQAAELAELRAEAKKMLARKKSA